MFAGCLAKLSSKLGHSEVIWMQHLSWVHQVLVACRFQDERLRVQQFLQREVSLSSVSAAKISQTLCVMMGCGLGCMARGALTQSPNL